MALRKTMFVIALASSLLTTHVHGGTVEDVLSSSDRSEADQTRDITSKPAAVLNLLGLKPGMVVLDLFAGGGYYSEVLAGAVGEEGKVYMHNNKAYNQFAGEALKQRDLENRMTNVVRYDKEIAEIDLPDDSVDMVLLVMAYHDVYWKADGWDLDRQVLFSMIKRVLRADGVLGIVDHVAAQGSGSSAVQELHRIEPVFAKNDIESLGFEFAGQTSALQNTSDNPLVSVFDPSVQGKTNRFVYKFVESQD
ncbi:MAG: methyltransferase domain-containing protein [Proteobacteria bacterium]|nr:methyltransferase domain-containing protein [Pseudomonadota bacterium]